MSVYNETCNVNSEMTVHGCIAFANCLWNLDPISFFCQIMKCACKFGKFAFFIFIKEVNDCENKILRLNWFIVVRQLVVNIGV